MIENEERGTCSFQHDKDTVYTVEELVAMQLAHAKHQCEIYAEESITDAIITVPPYWSHHERQAILDAADMAGIKVLSLLNDETAAAVNYAMTRTFTNEPQYHIFLDIGAGSTVASLVEFRNIQEKEGFKWKKNSTLIEVKAVGYDATLGGFQIDVRLQQHLAKKFHEAIGAKKNVDIFGNQRALAKLLKEANRVKHVLSANKEAASSVESLIDDIDFRTKVTRSELEEMMSDLLPRFDGPIQQALTATSKKMEDVQSVILVGGGVRVPVIQSRLESIVGAEKIARHVNADEAIVLGAAFRGATYNSMFRVKKMIVKDVNAHGIVMSYESNDGSKNIKQNIYPVNSILGSKKKVAFKKKSNFTVTIGYEDAEDILEASVEGVSVVLEKHAEILKSDADPKVKLMLELTDSGTIEIGNATVDFEVDNKKTIAGSIADTVKSFFGGSAENDDDDNKEEETKAKSDAANENTDKSQDANSTSIIEPKGTSVKKENLNVTITFLGVAPLTAEQKQVSMKKLNKMDQDDKDRVDLAGARNKLESYIYASREFVEKEKVVEYSTEEQRAELAKIVKDAYEWLDEEGIVCKDKKEFSKRYDDIKKLSDPIQTRIDETKCREGLVTKLTKEIKKIRQFVFKQHTNVSDDALRVYQNASMIQLSELADETDKWLTEKSEEQKKAPLFEKPVLTCQEIRGKISDIDMRMMLLKYQKRPKPTTTATPTPTLTVAPTIPLPVTEETLLPIENEETTESEDSDVVHEEL